ncbi:MAG: Phosphoribosylaminoimidazole-succinocarboxamide synthase [Spirochaetes bacterium ADurb.Bin218]|jgi:phosphoribosylaminoimidazole-succinocarboxamide synthase|nr:phosphoribosylaminoimidazolesuccinocarboxamide synthase [Spirochaetota bacterium]OQB00507.1 MAG: Phosphoribosylaminoimidazole-succinocarboxamide synthase [Spirochaetes bacterium ADurb.Bin218]HOQ12443.1 phosphoribosylaminoimidazolesuccinocarboxamide synthase [Spirochaetota bacterium]
MNPLTKIEIPEVKAIYSGKVRDLFPIDSEHMLIVSTDRISAFDHIFPNGIPQKGIILNTISNLWFKKIDFIKNHIVEANFNNFPAPYSKYPEFFKDRAVIVKKTKRIDFECVARGYIIGSGWKEYKDKGSVSGVKLPDNLKLADKLPETIFTPATKADTGHDENISIDVMIDSLGQRDAAFLRDMTIKIYEYGRDLLKDAGIILADTKFEFGYDNGEIVLIDEVLTPDSSRFWDASLYSPGKSPVSYDKQFIRDYLDTTPWDKNSPPPPLPEDIVQKTKEKYEEILAKIAKLLS